MSAAAAKKMNLLGADQGRLTEILTDKYGARAFHARQLLRWVHGRGVADFAVMTDLPLSLRKRLEESATLAAPPLISDRVASDGTRKFLFDAGDAAVEAVWIPGPRRVTLCVSSQAGCALGCTFCLTGKQGFKKNLGAEQISGQIFAASAQAGKISNVVFMGMGEPLLNIDAVVPVLRLLTDPWAHGISRRRVTVSTAGVVPGISQLGKRAPVALAVSLHAADDDLRSELVPLNRRFPLEELLEACHKYIEHAPRDFITFEYALLADVNDSRGQARDLAKLLRNIGAKINLIPFNPFPGAAYRTPSPDRVIDFRDELNRKGLVATIRSQRGNDILAACGQLAGEVAGRTPMAGRISLAVPA